MDLKQIALSRKELKILKSAKVKPVPLQGAERLRKLGLVDEIYTPVPGYMGTPTGIVEITDFGISFLIFQSNEKHKIFTAPIIVSILINLILCALRLLWPLIQGLLSTFLAFL